MVEKDLGYANIIEGKIVMAKDKEEDLENFVKRWDIKIKEIKELSLDRTQAYNLLDLFLKEWDKFILKKYGEKEVKNGGLMLTQLGYDVMFALDIANNNYRNQFPSFIKFFIKEFKPEVSLIKI